ncbi:MAG: hypothetical protein RL009_701, partial [Actinomycetota bacterium]
TKQFGFFAKSKLNGRVQPDCCFIVLVFDKWSPFGPTVWSSKQQSLALVHSTKACAQRNAHNARGLANGRDQLGFGEFLHVS